jgi:cyclohexa-1,5-dienecarbonyl-CoA hydratase
VTTLAARTIELEVRDRVAYLKLDRPPLNVLSIAMMRELIQTLEQAAAAPDRAAVVLRGSARAFSVGVDIGEHRPETLNDLLETFDRLIVGVANCAVPVIGVVDGLALGGGFELAIAADLLVVADEARLGVPEIKLGVFPPAACVLLPRRIGWGMACELILRGETVSGTQAAQLGLANRSVPGAEVDAAVEALVAPLRHSSGLALRLTRRALQLSQPVNLAAALRTLQHVQLQELIPSADAQEGLHAFLEKRPPVWTHH